MTKLELLRTISFGNQIAEQEKEGLKEYFISTDTWNQVAHGRVDVIYGPKGSGKSAIYSNLESGTLEFFNREFVIIVPADHPRGNPVFEDLTIDSLTEQELVYLWKLYILAITVSELLALEFTDPVLSEIESKLVEIGVLPQRSAFKRILSSVTDYLKKLRRMSELSPTVEVNEQTGGISGYSFKIAFREPTAMERRVGVVSINDLFDKLELLLTQFKYQAWVIIDRLDSAFIESVEFEDVALRALFRTYNDLAGTTRLQLKICLRDDIWARMSQGMAEASHVTRQITIKWNELSILNLIVKRILSNRRLVDELRIDAAAVLSTAQEQQNLFYRLFPVKVEEGARQTSTLNWIITRVQDGKQIVTPREVVHLLNAALRIQVSQLELGHNDLTNDIIIGRSALKQALGEVSKARVEQTVYAEYPWSKVQIEALRGDRATQSLNSLCRLWNLPPDETQLRINRLIGIGIFELRRNKNGVQYRIPFLYRSYLEVTQGTSES